MSFDQIDYVVPTRAEMQAMTDAELASARTEMVGRAIEIDRQITEAKASGDIDRDWLRRALHALSVFRAGLATAKAIRSERWQPKPGREAAKPRRVTMTAGVAVASLRTFVGQALTLHAAVKALIADDQSEERWAEVEQLVADIDTAQATADPCLEREG